MDCFAARALPGAAFYSRLSEPLPRPPQPRTEIVKLLEIAERNFQRAASVLVANDDFCAEGPRQTVLQRAGVGARLGLGGPWLFSAPQALRDAQRHGRSAPRPQCGRRLCRGRLTQGELGRDPRSIGPRRAMCVNEPAASAAASCWRHAAGFCRQCGRCPGRNSCNQRRGARSPRLPQGR